MKWSAIAVGMIAVVMQSTDAAMFGNMKKAPATKEIQLSTDIMPTWKDLAPRSNTKKIQLTRVYKYWATLEKRDKKAIKSLYSSLKEENKAVEKVDDYYDGAKKCLRKQDETKRKTRTAVNKALQEIAQCIKKTVTVPTFTVLASQNLPKDFDEVDKADFDDDDKDNDKDDDKDDDDDDGKTTGLAAKPTVTPTVVETPPTVMTMAPMLTPSPVALPVDVPLAPPLVHMPDVDVPPVRPTFSIAQLMEPVVDKDDGYNGPVNGGYQVGPKPEQSIDGGLVYPQEPLTPEQPTDVVNVDDGGYHGEPEPSIDGGLTFPEVLPAPEKPHEEIVGGDGGYQPPVGEPEPQQSIDGGFVYHEEPPTPELPHEYIIHGEGYYPTIADNGYHGETEPEPVTPIEPIIDNGNIEEPVPAGLYGYHGETEPEPVTPIEPIIDNGNIDEPVPAGLYGYHGETEPTGLYGNPGEPVLEPSKSSETLLAPGEQVSDLADVIQPTGLGLDPNSWPFSPVSPDVPPLWALDMDHSNAVDFNEWTVYLKRLHGMAMKAVEAGRDPVAVNLLRQIVDFHYGALGQCLMKKMGGPDGVQELHDPEYEAVAKRIQDNCYVKFRYSLFAGVPPFEWIAKDMPTVPASTIEKWFTHKVETARIDLHVKHIVSLAPEHEELVEKFIGCTYTILKQANDASVDRDAYYGALQQIEMCGHQ